MEQYSNENIAEALKIVDSTVRKCEKLQPKFSEGTSSHSLLENRIKSLSISKALMTDSGVAAQYSAEELHHAVKPVVSIINKCVSGQRKHAVESAQYKRFQKLIDAMNLCKALITDEIGKREQWGQPQSPESSCGFLPDDQKGGAQ